MVLVAQYFSLQPISEAVVMFTHYSNNTNTAKQKDQLLSDFTTIQTELGHNFFKSSFS